MKISQNLQRFVGLFSKVESLREKISDCGYKDNYQVLVLNNECIQLTGDLLRFQAMVKNGTFPPYYSEMNEFLKERYRLLEEVMGRLIKSKLEEL